MSGDVPEVPLSIGFRCLPQRALLADEIRRLLEVMREKAGSVPAKVPGKENVGTGGDEVNYRQHFTKT